jgi:hypothetical protein
MGRVSNKIIQLAQKKCGLGDELKRWENSDKIV